jgi:2-dehydro-3-deoxygalactonokinase
VGIVPGVSALDAHGVPEVMRGEETQIVGAAGAVGTVCLPGSHSKWAQVRDGRITGYATHLTGEAFAALRDHTILGRMMQEGPTDPAAFARGVARSGDAGGVLHHLFGVRTLGLTGQLTDGAAASYLSGLLIGHEVRAALPQAGGEVLLIGAAALCALYARAVEQIGGQPRMGDQDAAASGLTEIGRRASWN